MSLAPICLGVALATAGDTEVSMEGACWASAGLVAAAGYQVLVKSTQKNLKVRCCCLSRRLALFFAKRRDILRVIPVV